MDNKELRHKAVLCPSCKDIIGIVDVKNNLDNWESDCTKSCESCDTVTCDECCTQCVECYASFCPDCQEKGVWDDGDFYCEECSCEIFGNVSED